MATGKPGTTPGVPPLRKLDWQNPNAVAATAAVWLNAADTTLDSDLQDTVDRAADTGLLTPALAAQQQAAHVASGSPGAAWITAAAHHAYASCKAIRDHDDGARPNTKTLASAAYVVTCTWVGRGSHWRRPDQTGISLQIFHLLHGSKPGSRWQVSRIYYD